MQCGPWVLQRQSGPLEVRHFLFAKINTSRSTPATGEGRMKSVASIPRSMVERKPKHGEACTHCGVCCAATLCQVGQRVFDRPHVPGPCPALILDVSGKSLCGVAMNPRAFNLASPESDAELTRSALMLIGSGYGCDC